MLIQNEKMIIRKLQEADKEVMVKWLTDPEVLKYYEGRDNPHDLEKVDRHFYRQEDETTRCIVEYEEKAIGFIQFYPLDQQDRMEYGYWNPEEIIYGTDQFIGEVDYWGKGLGKLLVNLIKEYLLSEKQANVLVMDPEVWNERAIGCYEKCGFKKIKFLPAHELHEGEMKDCWLMEFKKAEVEDL
ncbi:GNAT family N-acetyltransferase [Planococcus sp. 1R117A]|uniref:GNAT family N-acetyltransferase n=1 Tax=Planococcus sp. 1R117A TaxID=3447020 RepID=UPI003EDBF0D3